MENHQYKKNIYIWEWWVSIFQKRSENKTLKKFWFATKITTPGDNLPLDLVLT